MRELKPEEKSKVLSKLRSFIGDNTENLLNSNMKIVYHKQKVFYLSNVLFKKCSQIGKDNLMSVGTILGKFTKTEKFRISISAFHVLSQYALHKVWIKNSAEMNFLYGNNAQKAHVLRTSESIPMNSYALVFNQKDVPLGLGCMALAPARFQTASGSALALLRLADTGEFIRNEARMP